jgi:hypothetical protein
MNVPCTLGSKGKQRPKGVPLTDILANLNSKLTLPLPVGAAVAPPVRPTLEEWEQSLEGPQLKCLSGAEI